MEENHERFSDTFSLQLLQIFLHNMFDQLSTIYKSLTRMQSSQLELAFHAVSRRIFNPGEQIR